MKLEIVHHPHPALRWKSREVTRIDAGLKDMIRQMFDLMYEAKGIGLAANQVALPYRLFVINPTGDAQDKENEMVLINPRITRRNGSEEAEEGCLSLPEVFGEVTRANRIVVDAFDEDGNQFELDVTDLPARVIQHENDHLDGILFPDRVTPETRAKMQPMLDELERQFREAQAGGTIANDDTLRSNLESLQKQRTEG
jgi:peptide deformylase